MYLERKISATKIAGLIIEKMKEEADKLGGDAILFLKVDMEQLQLSGTQYFVYGTLVKFK